MNASTTTASLDWTLKRSFVEYIAHMHDGRMSVTDGADVDGTSFRFALVSHEDHESGGVAAFRGDVRFAGHGNLLFVGIADPVVAYDDNRATVSIQLPATARRPAERIDFARGVLTSKQRDQSSERFIVGHLSLTDDGSQLFAGVYAPGELLDDLSFTIKR